MSMIFMVIAMFGLIWFMQRNQRKQAQERQKQLDSVTKGDEVVTIGGLYGVIDEVDVEAKTMVLDVDGVFLTFELGALKSVLKKADEIPAEIVETVSEVASADEEIVSDDTDTADTASEE